MNLFLKLVFSRSLWLSPLFIILEFLLFIELGVTKDPLWHIAKSVFGLFAMATVFSLMAMGQSYFLRWCSKPKIQ